MKMKINVIFEENGNEIKQQDIAIIERDDLSLANLGLTLEESKKITSNIQTLLAEQQVEGAVKVMKRCACCHKDRIIKSYHKIIYRTLFGKLSFKSPRLHHCRCEASAKSSFSPLAVILPERTSPELLYEESKLSALVSYGVSAKLLTDYFPVNITAKTVWANTHKISERLEESLENEKFSFYYDVKRNKEKIPRSSLPLSVGIDGAYVHAREGDNRKAGWFEVIVGKSLKRNAQPKRFGYVTTYDTKPKRRLFDMLKDQGLDNSQRITFISDGGENVRDLQLYLSPNAEHILDWFHITMRITVINQILRGINSEEYLSFQKDLKSIKWHLWHGHVSEALKDLEFLLGDFYTLILDMEDKDSSRYKLWAYADDLHKYLTNNQNYIINYSERYHHGEIISSAFVESTVNELISKRMVKKQQMRWTKQGAHLLLQVRVKTLNNELKSCFDRWYPRSHKDNGKMMAKAA